jgi:TRAP transporter TAXI family solute receptor
MEYRESAMNNRHVWCIASIPSVSWAKKVFPDLQDEEAVEMLWRAILKTVRVDTDDPVDAWRKHINSIAKYVQYMNSVQFKTLHYTNSLGTDLNIELPENHIWYGGSDHTTDGLEFVANMPTEEVYTLPKKTGVNGRVVSSMALSYNGNLIDKFFLTFKDGKIANVRAIATLYPEVIQIVASVDSGINTIADIKGKKFSVGAPGSGVEANARQILDVLGMTYNDFSPNYLSFSESGDAFKDKHIDGFLFTSGIPNAAIQDITATTELKYVSIPDDVVKKLIEKYPFFTAYTIPAGTYRGQTSDVKTVAVNATLVVGSEVPEKVVYDLTKALFDNQAELATAHAKGKLLSLETAVKGISIPFHPGAEKFFKEKGAIK